MVTGKSQIPSHQVMSRPGHCQRRPPDMKEIHQIYNAMTTGAEDYRPMQYSVGQMLLDPSNSFEPQQEGSHWRLQLQHQHLHHDTQQLLSAQQRPLARLETPFLVPSTPEEERGQVDLVVFAEGLVQFKGKWFLYYGQADQTLGVADVHP